MRKDSVEEKVSSSEVIRRGLNSESRDQDHLSTTKPDAVDGTVFACHLFPNPTLISRESLAMN